MLHDGNRMVSFVLWRRTHTCNGATGFCHDRAHSSRTTLCRALSRFIAPASDFPHRLGLESGGRYPSLRQWSSGSCVGFLPASPKSSRRARASRTSTDGWSSRYRVVVPRHIPQIACVAHNSSVECFCVCTVLPAVPCDGPCSGARPAHPIQALPRWARLVWDQGARTICTIQSRLRLEDAICHPHRRHSHTEGGTSLWPCNVSLLCISRRLGLQPEPQPYDSESARLPRGRLPQSVCVARRFGIHYYLSSSY